MINQEEYEVLKALDSRAKSIVRQARGWLWVAEQPIMKDEIGWYVEDGFDAVLENDNILHFIQWEDREPYSIAELIEGYESEETEVNKQKLIEKWESAIEAAGFYGKGKEDRLISYMQDFVDDLNQLDEPEVKQLERKIKELESFNDELIRDNNQLRNELDNQEILSQELPVISEYIVELIKRAFDLGTTSKTIEALTGMTIEQVAEKIIDGKLVPEQELPVIPKYVADWMEENSTGRCAWWKKIAEWEGEVPDKDRKVYDWYTQSNEDTFIIAWITRHYEVEEEPLYYVMKDGVVILSKRYRDYDSHESHWIGTVTNKEYIKENPDKVRFTEQEIKDYDERFWAFAVPVDEVSND